jgi:hypothetical protein
MPGHFEGAIFINSPIDSVYGLLNHPQRIVGLQPLIASVEILDEGINAAGCQTYHFVSFEDIRLLGIFPLQNRIQTEMILENPPYKLTQVGRTAAGIVVYQTIVLEENAGQTQVTNQIDYDVHWLLLPYVRREITRAHTAWLHILKARAENQ